MVEERTVKDDVVIEANTNIKAVVRITVPMRTIQEEVEVLDPETLLPIKTMVDRQVEADQEDKALLIAARTDALPYSI